MSFLKKIFGSGATAEAKPHVYAQEQRSPRVMVSPLHRIRFTPVDTKLPQKIDLSNISTGGMALLIRETKPLITLGDSIAGQVMIDQKQYAVEAKIKHLSQVLIGCEFLEPSNDFREAVRNYLRVEISALRLRKVNEAYMKPDPRGSALWYSDGNHGEFYSVTDPSGLVYFHMSFLGYYIEGGRGTHVRGGFVKADDHNGVQTHKGSDLVDLSKSLDPEVGHLAMRFVKTIEDMPANLIRELETQIEKSI